MTSRFKQIICFLLVSASISIGQIQNIQFKDLNDKSYDLYKLLEAKKYLYVEMVFNA